MPLVKFDMVKGRSKEEITKLLTVSHQVFSSALALPAGDRFQVVNQHEEYELVMEDVGLGYTRTANRLLITIISKERLRSQKEALYQELATQLQKECGLDPQDLMISLITNTDEDWSFGNGEAAFLNGRL